MKKDNLSKFYLTYRLYIFPTVIVLSSLILIIFIIYPQVSRLISNTHLEKELKNKHGVLEAKAKSLESLDQKDLSDKVNSVLAAYPAEKDFASVVGLLQNLTSQSGFNIATLALGASGGGKYENSQSYSVKLEILGPKSLFEGLISSIESSPRIMRVTTMDVTSTRDADILGVVLGVEVLYASLPETFGTVDSPLPNLSSQDEEIIAKLATVPIATSVETVTLSPRGKSNPFE